MKPPQLRKAVRKCLTYGNESLKGGFKKEGSAATLMGMELQVGMHQLLVVLRSVFDGSSVMMQSLVDLETGKHRLKSRDFCTGVS